MIVSEQNYYHFSTPYAGIPRSCQICTNDVLEHQILHLIVHLNCKFCRQEFRPFEYRSIVNIYDFKMAEVELRKEEDSTCPSCLKVCFDKKSCKRHEKRSHGSHTCTDCQQIFTSRGKLNYHCQLVHTGYKNGSTKDPQVNVETFECNECEAKFNKNFNLIRHLKEVHLTTSLNVKYVQLHNLTYMPRLRYFLLEKVLFKKT